MKDTDTQKVYVVRKGKLFLDPRFLKGSEAFTTLRRLGFVLCIVGIGVWAVFRACGRTLRAAAPRSAQ